MAPHAASADDGATSPTAQPADAHLSPARPGGAATGRTASHGPSSGPGGPGTGATSPRGWDELTEQERRRRLDAMDPADLRAMAASMPLIEQAKGIVMGCFGCDAPTAFALLRRTSSTSNVKLRVLAASVVEAVGLPGAEDAPDGSTSPEVRVRRLLEGGRPTPDQHVAAGRADRVDAAG